MPYARNQRTLIKLQRIKRELPLHLMLIPGIVIIAIFCYLPMFGIIIAFQKFNPLMSFKSPFIGLENFRFMFNLPTFWQVVRNTVEISFMRIVFGLITPIVISLLINELRSVRFMRATQVVLFIPYFLSWVILTSIFREMFSLNGIVNSVLEPLLGHKIFFMADGRWFRAILIITGVWQGMGYNIVIYSAAIIGTNPALYEAAIVDGAGRFRRAWHVTLPAIRPIIILLTTLSIGGLLSAGFDQIYLMYNPLVYESADVLDTFIYRLGMTDGQYGVSSALSLVRSVVGLFLVGSSYYLAYKFSDYRIF
ncbi:MAG: ABC transporter permease [Christensenellales bacterium]